MLTTRRALGLLSAFGLAAAAGAPSLTAAPEGEREISFYHIHTKESLTVTYKKNGRYIPEAMDKLDWVLRDWRKDKATKMSPETIDVLWEIHTELGSREPIHIISGYRSPETNEMLRRTVGGQAKNSQHMTGKAIDVYFPDVPSKFVRYAALVRERGGVGYYPTSALPFTHVDTGRVRHWPSMSKDELALLFPNGRSKHASLSPGDYERAKSRKKELAIEVANYFELKMAPKKPVSLVASIGLPQPPAPKPAQRPATVAKTPPAAVVAAAETEAKARLAAQPQQKSIAALLKAEEPKLIAAPRMIERPSRFAPAPSNADRQNLDRLVKLAALDTSAASPPAPKLVAAPKPAVRPAKPPAAPDEANAATATPEGSFDPDAEVRRAGWDTTTWTAAPAFDEDHPEELSYRPFPLGPLLTATASLDDPALAQMVHPDLARTLEVIDDAGEIQPMRFRPRQKVAELMWSQQFHGRAVQTSPSDGGDAAVPQGLSKRAVRTTSR